jgi:uncharacterized delta-60 repeat protein
MPTLSRKPNLTSGLTRLAAAAAITFALSASFFAANAQAALTPGSPGSDDSVFNANSTSAGLSGEVRAVAVQSDGKIIAAAAGGYLARFNTNGTLDASFGTGGVVTGEGGYGVIVQSDGKIVVGNGGGVKRFSTDGTPDTTFNANAAVAGLGGSGQLIQQQPSGKIVALWSGGLKRLNTDGTLDTTFGTGGNAGGAGGAYAIAAQGNGDILVTGEFTNHLKRFSADGVADTAFNSNVAASTLPAAVNVYSVAVQADQKIIVGYWGEHALQRFNTNGTPDSAFNANAAALGIPSDGNNALVAIAVQSDTKIIIGAQPGKLQRLSADGTIDTSFGDAGTAETVVNRVWAMQIGTDGRLVAGTDSSPGLMRFFATTPTVAPIPDAPTGLSATAGDGQATIAFTPGADNGAAITNYQYQLDGGEWVALSPADTSSPVTITGLTNGTAYQVRLRAVTAADDGLGAASDPVSVTPVAPTPVGPTPVGPPPVNPDVGISINNGAQYTNNPNVRLKLVWPLSSTLARIANDGGFGDAQNRALASSVNWRLSSSGPERLPKTVYVRFQGSGSDSQTFTDDIILDQTAPKVTRATMTRGRTARGVRSYAVSLRGADGTSGVSTFQITTNRSKPGSLKRFDRSFTYRSRSAKPKLYVRIRDRAGNNSGWKRIN